MKVTVNHSRSKREVIDILDQPLGTLFGAAVGGLEIANEKRDWNEGTLTFSFIGRIGFISIPVSGMMAIEETVIDVDVTLPPVVNTFVGEEKVRAGISREILALVS